MTNQEYLIGVMNDVEIIKHRVQDVLENVSNLVEFCGGDEPSIDVENGVLGTQLWADFGAHDIWEEGIDGVLAWEFNPSADNPTKSCVRLHDSITYGLPRLIDVDNAKQVRKFLTMLQDELRGVEWSDILQVLSVEVAIDDNEINEIANNGGMK